MSGPAGNAPPAFDLVCRQGGGTTAIAVRIGSRSALPTDRAAALVLLLARAHVGPDRRPKWTTVGDVLQHVGRGAPGLFDRKALETLVRQVRQTLTRRGIPSSLLERDDEIRARASDVKRPAG